MAEEARAGPPPTGRLGMYLRFFVRPVITLFVVVVGLLAVWIIAAPFVARRYADRVAAACPPSKPTLEKLAASYPRTGVNASARRLEELAAAVGIDVATSQKTGRARPDESTKQAFKNIKEALGTHLTNQVKRADDRNSPAPASVRSYLERVRPSITAIEEHILRSDLPVWEQEPGRLESPIPNLLGEIDLEKLLVLDALEKDHAGSNPQALAAIDAAWKLNRSLWDRPELICHLIALSANRWQQRALRVMTGVPSAWEKTLASYDPRTLLFRSLRMETWMMVEGVRREPQEAVGSLGRGAARWVFRPYLDIGMSDYAERRERAVVELERLGPCELDVDVLKRAERWKPEKWNIIGGAAWPNTSGDVVRRALRRGLDQELTILILRLKRGDDLPNPFPSAVCAGQSWRYRRSADGRLRDVEFSRRFREPIRDKTWELPLRYVARPPGRVG